MKSFFLHLKNFDWVLVTTALLLAGLGLLSIYSSSIGRGDFLNFQKQIIFLVIAISLMFFISMIDYRILRNDPYLILFLYVGSLVALAGLLLLAPEIRGVRGWYRIGPVSLDPIEPAKIILIVLLAKYFSMRHVEMYRIRHIILSGFYVLIPSLLIFLQPDLGSSLLFIILWGGILIVSGIKIRHFLILFLAGVVLLGVAWGFVLQDYQKERVVSFVAPQLEPLGAGWSQIQTRIAIGSGLIFGQGLGSGPQTQYGFLPEPQTDFIFASFAEEFGLVGVLVLLISFLILMRRIIQVAISAQYNFPRLFAAGFAILLSSQIIINIGMNLGLLPVIGISLPLVSYGGSSLIMTFVGVGILLNIKANQTPT